MEELRKALFIIMEAMGPKVYDRRTKEHRAFRLIEETLFPANVWTPEEIDRIIDEVMNSSEGK